MVFKPAYLKVNPHAINPKAIQEGLNFAGVCPWVEKYKGDIRYSGRSCKDSLPAQSSSPSELEVTLDEVAADNGEIRTQDEWIAYFNERNELMASIADIYLAGKSDNQTLLAGLGEDFKRWSVTSTRIKYDETNARIIHHYGSTVAKPVEHAVIIPEYRQQFLEEVLKTKEGLRYLQVLFGTNDSAQQIKENLRELSAYSSKRTVVWSTAVSARPDEKVAGFIFGSIFFHIIGSNSCNLLGYSRGVRV